MPYPETIKYIKKQLDDGIKPERIRKALLDHGYQQEIVDKLMKSAGVKKEEKKPSEIEKLLMKDVAIGVVLLLIIGSLVYFNFFSDSAPELLSPKPIKLNFGRLSPLELEENGVYTIDLVDYVKDKNYEIDEIELSYGEKSCINIKVSDGKAVLRSTFLPKCPSEENIKFTVTNPDGETSSDNLLVKIV